MLDKGMRNHSPDFNALIIRVNVVHRKIFVHRHQAGSGLSSSRFTVNSLWMQATTIEPWLAVSERSTTKYVTIMDAAIFH